MRAAIYRRDPRLYFETGHILSAKLAFPLAIYVTRFEKIAAKIDNFPGELPVKNLKNMAPDLYPVLVNINFSPCLISFIGCTCCLIPLNILYCGVVWHQVLKLILFFSFFPFSICFKIGRSKDRWKNFWEKINDKGNNLFRCIVFLNEILDRYANIFGAIVRFQGFIRSIYCIVL